MTVSRDFAQVWEAKLRRVEDTVGDKSLFPSCCLSGKNNRRGSWLCVRTNKIIPDGYSSEDLRVLPWSIPVTELKSGRAKRGKLAGWKAALQWLIHCKPCHARINSTDGLYSMTQLFRSNTINREKKTQCRKELKSDQDCIRFLFSSKTRDHNIQTHERWQVFRGRQQGQIEKGHFIPKHLHVSLCLSVHPSIQKKNQNTWDKISTTGDITPGEAHTHCIGECWLWYFEMI